MHENKPKYSEVFLTSLHLPIKGTENFPERSVWMSSKARLVLEVVSFGLWCTLFDSEQLLQ